MPDSTSSPWSVQREKLRRFHWRVDDGGPSSNEEPFASLFVEGKPLTEPDAELGEDVFLLQLDPAMKLVALGDFFTASADQESISPALESARANIRELAHRHGQLAVSDALQRAGKAVVGELTLDAGSSADLKTELDGRFPEAGVFVSVAMKTPWKVFEAVRSTEVNAAPRALAKRAMTLAAACRRILEADDSKLPSAREAAALDQGMGALGSQFVDSAAMSQRLGAHRGGLAIGAERRQRLDEIVAILERPMPSQMPVLVTDEDDSALCPSGVEGWEQRTAGDPITLAAELFDQYAAELCRRVSAMKLADLEIAGAFRPEEHSRWLQGLDWRSLDREEIRALPPIVAMIDADRLSGAGIGRLIEIILSGRPLVFMVAVDPAAPTTPFDGTHLGLGFPNLLVHQTAMHDLDHVVDGFVRGARQLGPCVHVFAVAADPDVDGAKAVLSRAHPLLLCDPSASSLRERIDLGRNPDPDAEWVSRTTVDGSQAMYTFAHFALDSRTWDGHFMKVEDTDTHDELVALSDWLADPLPVEGLPFIWALEKDGGRARMVISRELSIACLRCSKAWLSWRRLADERRAQVSDLRPDSDTRIELEADNVPPPSGPNLRDVSVLSRLLGLVERLGDGVTTAAMDGSSGKS